MDIDVYCPYPFNRVRITSEGWVSFCCFMRPGPSQSNEEFYLGNVLTHTFDQIWFGEKAEAVRQSVLANVLDPQCHCPGCPFLGQTKLVKENVIYNEYPTFLELDLPNTHCNVGGLTPDPVHSPACIMCERASPHFKPEKNHLFEVLARIKHIIPNLDQIHVQGIAEPFYQTRQDGFLFFDLLDAVDFDQYAQKITISVTTNGLLFKENVRKQYLSRVPRSITTFSIDAGSSLTYKRIRIFDCFDRVLDHLYAFGRERVSVRQFMKIHNNINTMNVAEVKEMVKIGHISKTDCLEFNPTDGFNHLILVNDSNCGKFARAQEDIVEECARLKVPYKFLRPLDLGLVQQLVQLTI